MSHRTPRESKSTPLVNQSQSASDSAFNVAAVPSRLIVIFREVRYDSPIEINVRARTQKNYVPTPRARHPKVCVIAVMIRRRCQAKIILGRSSKRHETYVPCSVSGTDHASIFFLVFFRRVDCGCNDALLPDQLSSVAIPRHRSSTRRFNSRYPHAVSQPHETLRQFVTPTSRARQLQQRRRRHFLQALPLPRSSHPAPQSLRLAP